MEYKIKATLCARGQAAPQEPTRAQHGLPAL